MSSLKTYRCEWGGMHAEFTAETRSKARYMAYKCLREWWGLRNLLAIKVYRA